MRLIDSDNNDGDGRVITMMRTMTNKMGNENSTYAVGLMMMMLRLSALIHKVKDIVFLAH